VATATNGSPQTFTYTATHPITQLSANAGSITVTTNPNHGLSAPPPNSNVAIATGLLAYDDTSVPVTAPVTGNTFTYAASTFKNANTAGSWSVTAAGIVTLTTASAHGLVANNTINIAGFGGGQTFMNGNWTVTTATATTFSFSLGTTHTAQSGNQQGN